MKIFVNHYSSITAKAAIILLTAAIASVAAYIYVLETVGDYVEITWRPYIGGFVYIVILHVFWLIFKNFQRDGKNMPTYVIAVNLLLIIIAIGGLILNTLFLMPFLS